MPILRRLHREAVEWVEDLVRVTSASRRYHQALVRNCGNQTMIILAATHLVNAQHYPGSSGVVDPAMVRTVCGRIAGR